MKIKKFKAPTPEMSGKRSATTDLNHDNWDKEEMPEEKGVFKVASSEELQNRVIKKAKRRVMGDEAGNGEPKGIFSGFTGFSTPASTASTVSGISSASPFSFLSKINSKSATDPAEKTEKQNLKVEEPVKSGTFHFEKSSTYYAKLKGLNQAVSSWIKKHVDENPLCILSPIFQDYEKHLKEIEQDKPQTGAAGTQFSFGTSASSNGNDKVKLDLAESKNNKESNTFKLTSVADKKIPPAEGSKPTTSSSQLFSFLKADAGASSTATSAAFSMGGQKTEASTVTSTSTATFSFAQKKTATPEASTSSTSLFAFTPPTTTSATSTTGFSFSGSGKPFTFGASVAKPESSSDAPKEQEEEEEDQPPKVEFKPVVEDDSVYSKKCKVFVKQGASYADRGIGTLYLKPVKDSKKTQLLVRADTNLGNILLNLILNESIPAQRMGKNNVMIVCIPTPESEQKPSPILLRVKTGEEADELLETINKYKK